MTAERCHQLWLPFVIAKPEDACNVAFSNVAFSKAAFS
jgi:hypothetical protein